LTLAFDLERQILIKSIHELTGFTLISVAMALDFTFSVQSLSSAEPNDVICE